MFCVNDVNSCAMCSEVHSRTNAMCARRAISWCHGVCLHSMSTDVGQWVCSWLSNDHTVLLTLTNRLGDFPSQKTHYLPHHTALPQIPLPFDCDTPHVLYHTHSTLIIASHISSHDVPPPRLPSVKYSCTAVWWWYGGSNRMKWQLGGGHWAVCNRVFLTCLKTNEQIYIYIYIDRNM